MMKRVFFFTAVAFAAVAALSQAPRSPHKGGNPEAAKVKNPVEATTESVAAGRRAYQRLCVRCHGAQGKGDGGAAGAVPADLTSGHWEYGGTDGEIFSAIHDGTSADMEGYAPRMSDVDIWNVVNYLRTLAAKS
jgi:mono/diheme cytochrome c family protein